MKKERVSTVIFRAYIKSLPKEERQEKKDLVCTELNIPEPTYDSWLTGTRRPTFPAAWSVAKILGWERDKLFPAEKVTA